MSHLVVVDIVDVHGPGAADHLLRDQRGVEVPQYDVRDGPHAGEEPAAVSPWTNVAATLPPGLEPLPADLRDRPEQAAREPVRPGQIPGDAATRVGRTTAQLDLAHRQHRSLGVTAEEVRDTHAAVGQQTAAVGGAALDLGGVGGPVGHQHPPERPVVPPERGYAVDAAVQDPQLAGRRGRRQHRGPLHQAIPAVADPAPHGGQRGGQKLPAQDRERHPVQLDEDDAGSLGILDRLRRRRVRRTSAAVNASGVPEVHSHATTVAAAAAIQAAASTTQNESASTPGISVSASARITACPSTASRSTASQPIAALATTSSGRTSAPTTSVAAAAASNCGNDVNPRPGSTAAAKARARTEVI